MKGYQDIAHLWARRRLEMRALRARGWTLQRIGDRYGISRQRVGQIVNGHA